MRGRRRQQDERQRPFGRRIAGAALALAAMALVAGCANDPGATLIPMPEPEPTTLSAADVPATTPDGYPNVSAMPVVVGGEPLTTEEQAASEKSLAGDLASHANVRPASTSVTAAQLQAIGATHAARARQEIGGS